MNKHIKKRGGGEGEVISLEVQWNYRAVKKETGKKCIKETGKQMS